MNNNQQEAHEWHSPQLRVAKGSARAGVGCNATGIVTSKCGEKTGTHCHQDVLEAVFVDRGLLLRRAFALLDGVLHCSSVLLYNRALYLCVLLRHLHHTHKRESVREDEECHHRKAHGNQGKRETRSFLVFLFTMTKYSQENWG